MSWRQYIFSPFCQQISQLWPWGNKNPDSGIYCIIYLIFSHFTVGVSLISRFCWFDILYNFYWYSEYIDIHYIVIDKPCVITSFILRADFPVKTSCPNRHNYGTNQLIKMFLLTELCATSIHISTLFLNIPI